MITVTVFSTQTSERISVNVDSGTEWGDLKTKINEAGVNPNGMKAMVRSSRVTLDHANAQIPTEDFTLILTPTKVKSGL